VRAALARVGLEPTSVREIPGGWANFTFDLDGEHIVRFPRTDVVALATQRELRILPELQQVLSYAVPGPSHIGRWHDRPFFAYRRIEGHPATPADVNDSFTKQAAAALMELHAFPADRAAQLLHLGPAGRAWSHRYEDLWKTMEDVALPEMEPDLADLVTRRFASIVERPPEFPTSFVHNDLDLEHYILDDHSKKVVAIIDFEDATVGDPAVDLVPLVAVTGHDALPVLTAGRDFGERLTERLRFYRWLGSVHAIIYGVSTGNDEERLDRLTHLRRRIAA